MEQARLRSKHSYELVVRKDDADDAKIVLLTGIGGDYWLRGWVIAGEVKRDEFWVSHANRAPQFYVPHRCLRSAEALVESHSRRTESRTV